VKLWDVGSRTEPPPDAAVTRLSGRGFYRALLIDSWRGEPVVSFTDPDVEIDLGGIAKGYGVDRAVDALRRAGVTQALVNVGGDLYALGNAGDGGPWRIGIRSPEEPGRLAGELEVRDVAVATSGDYLQFFQHGGRRYHHLLDPVTGAPRVTAVHSLTIQADTCLAADAAATALYGMPRAEAERLLRVRAPGARLVSEISGCPPPPRRPSTRSCRSWPCSSPSRSVPSGSTTGGSATATSSC
jgi:thiamine biosynthesis lipoprotein